jgi:hypothetical protein
VTQVICGYSLCFNKTKDSGTVYQQNQRHLINKLIILMYPREHFCEGLLRQMKQWREAGKRLVLCLDANENIYRAELGWQLTDLHGLGMMEVVGDFTGRWLGATFFRGREPIDAIWGTRDLNVANACIMPVGYGVSDHHLFVVNFSTASMIGTCPPKIVWPALHRLNTKIPGCALRYSRSLQKYILHHQLLERMIHVAESKENKEVILAKLNKHDREGEQYMKHAEKKCCQIKLGCIPFSPEALLWICQCQVYHYLLQWRLISHSTRCVLTCIHDIRARCVLIRIHDIQARCVLICIHDIRARCILIRIHDIRARCILIRIHDIRARCVLILIHDIQARCVLIRAYIYLNK